MIIPTSAFLTWEKFAVQAVIMYESAEVSETWQIILICFLKIKYDYD